MSASLFDLFCLEVIPETMHEVERLRRLACNAVLDCIDGRMSETRAALIVQAHQDAIDQAKRAFRQAWPAWSAENLQKA